MATQEILRVNGTQLLFADATDFPNAGAGPPATAANSLIIGSPTKVQIDLTNIAAAAGRQSTKTADLGAAWPEDWILGACIENESAPTAGGTHDFYWAGSPSATAGTGNGGNVTGADGAFTIAGNVQILFLGSLQVLNQVVNINSQIRTFKMPYRYGSLIYINNTSTATRSSATAMDETHIVISPVIPDVQAAA